MSVLGLLLTLTRSGIRLERIGTDLRYRAPAGVVTPEVRAQMLEQKSVLLEALADPRGAAQRAWEEALEDVASAWTALKPERREAVWVDDEEDLDLQREVADAIRAGDLFGTLHAIDEWRETWFSTINPTNPTSAHAGTGREATGGVVEDLESRARRLSGVRLFDLIDDSATTDVAREVYRAEILARADAIIAESEGRRPPPNPTVHAMLDEALARFGWPDAEQRSITRWLSRNAPEVAALWPDARVDASWFDWRCRVQPEHLSVLEQALKESLKGVSKK